jgi:hypothetical protein
MVTLPLESPASRTDQPFEMDGHWWLPACPARRVAGFLRFQPADGSSLKLIGGFDSIDQATGEEGLFEVHGELTSGEPVLLRDCYLADASRGGTPPRWHHQVVGAHSVLIFERGASPSSPLESVSFSLANLSRWIAARLVDPDFSNSATEVVYRVRTRHFREWQVEAVDSTVTLEGLVSLPMASTDLSIEIEWWLSLVPRIPKPFNWYEERLWELRDLLSLLVGEPLHFTQISAFAHAAEGTPTHARIATRQARLATSSSDLRAWSVLAPLPEIEDRFAKTLDSWLRRAPLLDPIRKLYFDRILSTDVYDLPLFVSLVQVVEGWHRVSADGDRPPSEDFEKGRERVRQAIGELQEVPRQLKNKLKSWLKRSHEPSLAERILGAIRCTSPDFQLIFFPDASEFAQVVATARNDLAHMKLDALLNRDGRRLTEIAERLRLLSTALLMHEAGLADYDSRGLERRYRHLRRPNV